MATELSRNITLKWRQFLSTPEGQAGMLYLREMEPKIRPDRESHHMIHDGGRISGYQEAINRMADVIGVDSNRPSDNESTYTNK